MKKLRIVLSLVTIIATPMGIGFYLYTRGVFDQVGSPLTLAKVIPSEATMTLFISPQPQAIEQLQKFVTPEVDKLLTQNVQGIQDQVLTGTSLDFDQDLKPWVGGIGLAFISPKNAPKSSEKMQTLWVIHIKNKLAAWQFMNEFKKQMKEQLKEINEQGNTFWEVKEAGGKSYNFTIFQDHILIADSVETIGQAIKTSQQKTSLAQQKPEIFNSIDLPKSLAMFYVSDYGEGIKTIIETTQNTQNIPDETWQKLQQIKSLSLAVMVDDLGIKIKGITLFSDQFKPLQVAANPGKILEKFPSDTMMIMSYSHFDEIWSQINNQAKEEPSLAKGLEQIKTLFKMINLDIDQDIFSWMNGEFAIGAIPSNQGMLSSMGMGMGVMIETNKRTIATQTLKKLDDFAKTNLVSVNDKNIQGIKVTEWKLPQQPQEAFLGHGWLNDHLLFMAVGEPIVGMLVQSPSSNFSQNSYFKLIRQSLPQPNQGYFYLDMEKMMNWLNNYPLKLYNNPVSPEILSLMNSIKAVGMTSTWVNGKTLQGEVQFLLKSSPSSKKI